MEEKYHGAIVDQRPEEARQRDFQHSEIVAGAGAVTFKEKTLDEIPFYEVRDQDGSLTCMNQAYAKQRGIKIKQKTGKYVPLSGGFLYRRKHTTGGGMALWDLFDLGKNVGLPFEVIDPSQKMSEAEILNVKELPYTDEVAKIFTDPDEKYVYLPSDFDAIAAVVEQDFPVVLIHYAQLDEYNITPKILHSDLKVGEASIVHGVCAHATTRYKGEDYLVMDDSWGILNSLAPDAFLGGLKSRGQRLLNREWVNRRVFGAGYTRELKFSFEEGTSEQFLPKPSHFFFKDLKFIAWDDSTNAPADPVLHAAQKEEVVVLQDALKYDGVLDRKVDSTGYYGSITAKAVLTFQKKYKIASDLELDPLAGRSVGPKTRGMLNKLF